uniref:G-protein coupled receptors family 1 profile domain-containing protein n=1 Tax=Leptobrachium leishanense TaxID=445787 RepID=A0A8C5Q9R2_9ANUR
VESGDYQGVYELFCGDKYVDHVLFILDMFSVPSYSVTFILGIVGNLLVIWITGFKLKCISAITVNVVWFLNLAIADFIFLFFLPLSITYLALGFHWPFGNFMCRFNSALAFLNMFASIFMLTVISIDRFICVFFPVWAQNHRTTGLASIVAVIVWILSLSFSITYFIFRDTYGTEDIVCVYNFHEDDFELFVLRHKATVITRFIVGFLIPYTVIASCYTVIALRLHRNRMTTSSKPFTIIIAVLISFFVCWFPYHVLSLLEISLYSVEDDFLSSVLPIGLPIASSLAFFNSSINPFLYVFIGQDFKAIFRTSIQSIFEKAFSEDSVQGDSKSKSTGLDSSTV